LFAVARELLYDVFAGWLRSWADHGDLVIRLDGLKLFVSGIAETGVNPFDRAPWSG